MEEAGRALDLLSRPGRPDADIARWSLASAELRSPDPLSQ